MEQFLNHESQSSRHGRHYNYGHKGALQHHQQEDHDEEAPTDPLLRKLLDEVFPTPLSELKRRQHHHPVGVPQQRRHPLPIPTRDDPILADAVALAAAIASTSVATPPPSLASSVAETTTATTPNHPAATAPAVAAPPTNHASHKTDDRQRHAAAHAVPNPAMQKASQQKSRYGFGREHVVPSVPAAPRAAIAATSVVSSSANASKTTTTEATTSSSSSNTSGLTTTTTGSTAATAVTASTTASSSTSTTPPILPSQTSSSSPPPPHPRSDDGNESPATSTATNKGAAYERKKQRARTARIKLNESIDRMAIAISLAGTQSKVRAEQWEARQQEQLVQQEQQHQPSADSAAAATSTTSTTTTNNKNNNASSTAVARIIRDCVETAEGAKKWDRPSFVGSAASLIQGMNAQCEALMGQVSSLQAELLEQARKAAAIQARVGA